MMTFNRFKSLPFDAQLDELSQHAVSLDVFITRKGSEVALFALHDFYVELYVKRFTDDIIKISPFRSLAKLEAYLPQVDIEDIKSYLHY